MARRLAHLAWLAVILGSGLVPWGASTAEPGCAVVEELPGVGRGCRDGPYWRLLLPDGRSVLTHGPDPVPDLGFAADAVPPVRDLPWVAGVLVPPACQPPDHLNHHMVLVYARAADSPDRYAEMAPQIREMATLANTLLFRETLVRYRVLCDGVDMVVRDAVLPTPSGAAGPGTIFNDLSRGGYNLPNEKYWVWYDGFNCWCGGIATIDADSRLALNNANNRGPDWALTFGLTGFSGWFVMMHENGHNLGAVQLDTPQASGGFHCNDGWDVMCYADGGSTSHYNGNACPPLTGGGPRWDCHKDDYAALAPGSEYLATHWNVASPLNRYITHTV